jgi:plastocyanin
MHKRSVTFFARATCALVAAFGLVACAGGGGAGWTYAPLGPSQSAGAGQSGAPASPGGSPSGSPAASPPASPGGSPAGSPGASPGGSPGGTTLDVSTEQATSLVFTPNTLTAPANASVTVTYNNNSSLPHNIVFFNGADSSAQKLGETPIVTGPNAPESVTFTTPAEPGAYYFWCQVHGASMAGTLQVQ